MSDTSLATASKKILIAATAAEAVIQAAAAAALVQYTSVSDASQRRDEANRLLDGLTDALLIICGDQTPVDLYDDIRALRALINESIKQQALSLPEVAEIAINRPTPTLVLSQDIYSDASHGDALALTNKPPHPLFFSGTLEYLKITDV